DLAFLSLASGSPGIDAGNSTLLTAGITTDLAGNSRTVGSIDLGPYEYQGTLPVNLTNFAVKKQGVTTLITWQTASETNNDYFILERGTDPVNNMVRIKTIPSQGNSSTIQQYSYTDLNPLPGINYYRLLQKDKDGTVKELGIKAASFNLNAA